MAAANNQFTFGVASQAGESWLRTWQAINTNLFTHPNYQTEMTRLIFIFLSLLILTSCTGNESVNKNIEPGDSIKADTSKKMVPASTSNTAFKLDFFAVVPDTIDGCGEYFTYETTPFTTDKYIFLSNLTTFAIIKINGTEIYLNRDKTESKNITDKSYIAVYAGHGYKAVLKIKQTKMYDEGGFYSGTLQITGDKIKATFKVHGEAGC